MTAFLLYMASPAILYVIVELATEKSITRNIRAKKMYLILAGICMALMIGLRAPTNGSGDTMYYFSQWSYYSRLSFGDFISLSKKVDIEFGYQITVWALSQFFADGQWLLFLSGIFISISVCFFVFESCNNPVLALTVFNCLGLFNFMVQGLRQAIAMCICLWALEQCKHRNFIKFILLVLLASFFHASAIVFVSVYFICFKDFNIKSIGLFSILIGIAITFLPTFMNLINIAINDNYTTGDGSDGGGIVAIFIYVAILVFALCARNKDEKNYMLFFCMAITGLICMILRRTTSGIIERISHYFAFAQMALVSNSALRTSGNVVGNKAIINILIFVLCFGVAAYKASYSTLVPYLFFWQIR